MSERPITPGDTVDVISGPFAGGRCKVKAVDATKGDVHLLMLVLGEPAPFTVKVDQVKVALHGPGHS